MLSIANKSKFEPNTLSQLAKLKYKVERRARPRIGKYLLYTVIAIEFEKDQYTLIEQLCVTSC